MDKKTLRETFNQLAEEEIPHNTNLVPNVRDQLRPQNGRTRPYTGRVAALVAALFLFSSMTVAAAVIIYQQANDPGLETVDQRGLFTELDQTLVMNGITVTLKRGYADANRVALETEIQYDRASVTLQEDGFDITYRLINTATGEIFSTIPFGGGAGGGGGEATLVESTRALSFDATGMQPVADTLTLRLEITFNASRSSEDVSRGGSGGGGGGGSTQAPTATQNLAPVDQLEPFTVSFAFTLPFIEEYVVPATQFEQVSLNGIDIRVEQVSVTPSLTQIALCYTLPESDLLWIPYMVLVTERGEYAQELALPPDTTITSREICGQATYSIPYIAGDGADWTLEVRYLRSTFAATQDNADQLQALLANQGLEVDVFGPLDGQQTFQIALGIPGSSDDSANVDALLADAFASLGERINGPWTFTFQVP